LSTYQVYPGSMNVVVVDVLTWVLQLLLLSVRYCTFFYLLSSCFPLSFLSLFFKEHNMYKSTGYQL